MKYHSILLAQLFIILAFGIVGCNRTSEEPIYSGPTETPTAELLKKPFNDPIEPNLFELPSQAVVAWSNFAKFKPALVLYSNHPFTKPIAADRRLEINKILRAGATEEFENRARFFCANPLLVPPETVSAAIDNGIISELFLVLPNQEPTETLSSAVFGKSAVAAGLLTQDEADSLTLEGGIISGRIHGIPFHVIHPKQVAKVTKPAILHIDLGYFNGMYVNEVKTPAYDQIYNLVEQVKSSDYKVLATTLSFSNQEADFSLESRFMIRDLADLLRHPEYMKGQGPPSWALRNEALYDTTMFAESRARELTYKSVKAAPNDAAAHYALALDLFEQGHNNQGFAELDNAVQLDKGYGQEYLLMAERGTNLGKLDASINLLEKAAVLFPDNPFIRIDLASQLIQTGRSKDARPIIADLRSLEWSTAFHPNIPETLEMMAEAASVDSELPTSKTADQATDAAKSR